jgi:1,4-alpha-glucan branching enzyme
MKGYLSLILHAHLPFVRHPEHETFLEENWLFEAITETYLPLLQVLEGWANEGMRAPVTLTLTPTLCSMLMDPLLQSRYRRHLDGLIDLADKETHRTLWEKSFYELAVFYLQRLRSIRDAYESCRADLVGAFRQLQERGHLEIITCAATHALLPLLADHQPSLRAQILVARDHYRACFGRDPEGIWLPECAYAEALEPVLVEAGLRWFITDTQGILGAHPRPRYGMFAPVLTQNGLAVFGRDSASARQLWSRHEGYPGDPRYRDFYRDLGFDLDLDYLKPFLAAGEQRSFTGIKYYRITGSGEGKAVYERNSALAAADEHSSHFLAARVEQIQLLAEIMTHPPLVLCPYDAELFGHWWYEGVEFLNLFVRKAYFDQQAFRLVTPGQFLRENPTHQVATPAASSWGEEGYWRMWLNEKNEWIYPHLRVAQERMTELVRRLGGRNPARNGQTDLQAGTTAGPPDPLQVRALQQAGRELLLAQSSDWPFILQTGTSPGYARKRVTEHLGRFLKIYEQLLNSQIDAAWLAQVESQDNIFPALNYAYFG